MSQDLVYLTSGRSCFHAAPFLMRSLISGTPPYLYTRSTWPHSIRRKGSRYSSKMPMTLGHAWAPSCHILADTGNDESKLESVRGCASRGKWMENVDSRPTPTQRRSTFKVTMTLEDSEIVDESSRWQVRSAVWHATKFNRIDVTNVLREARRRRVEVRYFSEHVIRACVDRVIYRGENAPIR